MRMVTTAASDRRRQILQVGKLAGLGRVREVCRKLPQLVRRPRVALRLRRLCGVLQIGGDLLCHLRVFCGVRLLKLLQRANQLCKRRKLSAVGLRWGRYGSRAVRTSPFL